MNASVDTAAIDAVASTAPVYPEDSFIDQLKQHLLEAQPADLESTFAAINVFSAAWKAETTQYSANDADRAIVELLSILIEPRTKYDGRLWAYALLLALNRCPLSETEVAIRCDVTAAAVSKVVCQWADRFGLSPRVGDSRVGRHHKAEAIRPRRKRQRWLLKDELRLWRRRAERSFAIAMHL